MAKDIKETPILYGEDAERFLKTIEDSNDSPVNARLCQFDPDCQRCNGTGIAKVHGNAPFMCSCECEGVENE